MMIMLMITTVVICFPFVFDAVVACMTGFRWSINNNFFQPCRYLLVRRETNS